MVIYVKKILDRHFAEKKIFALTKIKEGINLCTTVYRKEIPPNTYNEKFRSYFVYRYSCSKCNVTLVNVRH